MSRCFLSAVVGRRAWIATSLLLVLLSASPLWGRPKIRQAFFDAYPEAVGTAVDTVPSHPDHCGACHYDFSGGGPRNPYGIRLGQVIGSYPNTDNGRRQAVLSIGGEDPDGDGFTSTTEATDLINYSNTSTFPGLTLANVGNVQGVALADIQGHLVPTTGTDTTPPDVLVLTPNGGGSYVANAPVTVQWQATDAGGIASIDLYFSEDNGTSFAPVALGLANTGSYTWFPPNRPTATGIFRVRATDNSSNTAIDDSDALSAITSPPGGLAPTTLRDFDLPGTQPLETSALNLPSDCAVCHGNYNTSHEPYYTWQGSMMAQASLDPLFEACMTIANQDAPDSGDLCLRCHLPRGWLAGRSVPTSGSQMLPADMGGVSCDLCHRMVDPIYEAGVSPAEDQAILAALSRPPADFGNGMFVVDPTGMRRGPFVDATSGHPILVSPFHREAAFCGSCHDVSNPAFEKDANGNHVPNAFDTAPVFVDPHTLMPIERTYSEWLHSDYNTPTGVYAPQFGGNKPYVATCQDCHMRDVTGKGCNLAGAPTRDDLPLHDMTGGSTWLPGLLSTLFPGQVNDAALAAGVVRARYMLQNAAELAAVQEGTRVKVTVTNNSGHKLPTGYPEGRRIWLNVRLYDAGAALIWESGAYDAATGTLSHDAAAKIYEAKPGLDAVVAGLVPNASEGPSFHFVLNNRIFKDNRIPPRGFTNAAFAPFGGTPVGTAYADGQYWDDTLYTVVPGAASAEVRLYYQSTSREYIEFLRDENHTDSAGQTLYDLWNNNGKCPPELMASVTLPVFGPDVEADLDRDTDVDLDDFGLFQVCITGPELGPYGPGCEESDFDDDGDVDQSDFGLFQRCISGAGTPADPTCGT
jgi:hypothetical protein